MIPNERPLLEVAREAGARLVMADDHLRHSDDDRLAAAVLIAECRERVRSGDPAAEGLDWCRFCARHFPQYPERYIRRLAAAGARRDPRAGIEELHARNRRDGAGSEDRSDGPEQAPFDVCVAVALGALPRPHRRRVLLILTMLHRHPEAGDRLGRVEPLGPDLWREARRLVRAANLDAMNPGDRRAWFHEAADALARRVA